jgi:hypothetical protein
VEGYNESLLRSKRHQLNESPKGVGLFWQEVLTATLLDQKGFGMFFGLSFFLP